MNRTDQARTSAYRLGLPVLLLLLLFGTACDEGPQEFPWIFPDAAEGCGEFILYRYSDDGTIALYVNVDMELLRLQPGNYLFKLARSPEGISVLLHEFATPAFGYYCDSIQADPEIQESWHAVSGEVEFTLSAANGDRYTVEMQLRQITFADAEETEAYTLRSMDLGEVEVGWYPGP